MKGKKFKDFLKSKNGVALVAVMFILLILTLFIPAIYTLGENAYKNTVKGSTFQRASYFARTIAEMSVASFTKIYDDIKEANDSGTLLDDQNAELKDYSDFYDIFLKNIPKEQKAQQYGAEYTEMKTDTLYFYYKDGADDDTDGQYIYNTERNTDGKYGTLLGSGSCKIEFDNTPHFYIVFTEQTTIDGFDVDGNPIGEHFGGDIVEIGEDKYNTLSQAVDSAITAGGTSDIKYTVTKTSNQQIVFTSTATVGEITKTRGCTIIIPTYPSKQGWLYFAGTVDYNETDSNGNITRSVIKSGCNQVQLKPDMKTGRAVINYSDAGIDDKDYASQPLQIYSCLGNMVINANDVQDSSGKKVINGKDNSELVLGMNPTLNTSPSDDPYFNIIDGINGADYSSDLQRDNFVALTATNSIQIDVPINLMVNGLRGNRLGDGTAQNSSIYKVMILQAPVICFNRYVDMMASLYVNELKNGNARRMSSVTLMAPKDTPYSYYNEDRKKTVKAGKVYFGEDCYLWVINHSDNGTGYSDKWYEVNETVWMRDKNFTKVKIASAGDVYYFNSEVEMETEKEEAGFLGITRKVGSGNYVLSGVPLTAWALETYYYENYYKLSTSNYAWWQVWKKAKEAVFGYYISQKFLDDDDNRTYKTDDMHYIGNIYGGGDIEMPKVDGFYTVWND